MTEYGPFDEQVISLAEVRDETDAMGSGSFLAFIKSISLEKRVTYVSPFGNHGNGGFIAIPKAGAEILVVKPANSNRWFYLGTSLDPEPKDPNYIGQAVVDSNIAPVLRADPDMYKAQGIPTRYLFKSPAGGGLTIADDENTSYMKKYTEVKSAGGKKIRLDDTPNLDSIVLDSGNGSKILLTSAPDTPFNGLSARSVEVQTNGPQKYLNFESNTDMYVGAGGGEISILNSANGVLNGTPFSVKPPFGLPPPLKPSGNVNIQSTWRDVNVLTKAPNGRIFIECLNATGIDQRIIIETNGVGGGITIKTNGNVMVESLVGVDITTPGYINMACAGFSLNATTGINIQAPLINIGSGQSIVNLAPPTPPVIIPPQAPSTNPALNWFDTDYGNLGVNTYDIV
jgi:hypothetical protein